MDELCDLPASEARRLIGEKAISPSELTESCIRRIDEVNPAVNAMVACDFATARAVARRQDQAVLRGEPLGPLHGLPLGVKDMIDAAGLPTTFGSLEKKDNVPQQDERLVAVLRAAGANIVGKTNVPEWGAGGNSRNAVYGTTGNPFDTTRSASGSSGGSAAALACGMVSLATGSDTGGSLRNPAAFNGVVGFRPTAGMIPAEKRGCAWLQISTLGPMGRTVDDVALMFSVMIGEDARDPLSHVVPGRQMRHAGEFSPLPDVDLASLRMAFTPDFGFAPTETGIATCFAEKIQRIVPLFARADATTPDCYGANESFETLRSLMFLTATRELYQRNPAEVGENVRMNVEEGLRYSAQDIARGLDLQTQLYRRWQTFFHDYDYLISPAVTISPRPWTELWPREINGQPTRTYYHWLALAYVTSLAGVPSISLPVGRDQHGMPFGLQIIGRRGDDSGVLRVAKALEQAFKKDPQLARPLPDISALQRASPIAAMDDFYLPLGQ
ncbi:TPA: amidase [Klebsiella michiganensis]|uniref:amidase n=1 Tax=Enterobacter hormaechei TaxID=158836 RepID=UPI0039082973|nr:amidase [Enterobacter hormaechei subsp. steigerwaltii]HAV1583970.1 amidase [Enterobacter hormaechei subsp. steigerwaltii]HAV1867100.1 amidase [Enterobacter hormaechei subsp. steigerwaltii]